MRYLLLVYLDENLLSESERQDCYEKSTKLAHELAASGKFIATAPLQPTGTASSVRVRDGKRLITEGPFAETREQLGGYYLIHADSPEEAIEIAERIPAARVGTIEVRPLVEISGLP